MASAALAGGVSLRVPGRLAAGGAAAVLTVAVGAANGGYFPAAWGWTALVLAWAALLAALLRERVAVTPLAAAFALAGFAFVGWVALSTLWSGDPQQTVLEVERDLIYAAAALALVVVGRRWVDAIPAGCLVGIVSLCGYALVLRTHDALAGGRLTDPVGYWNALGLLAAMGALLATGFVVDGRGLAARVLAGGALPVLLTTLYLTYSRGAWLALGIGLALQLALRSPRAAALALVLALVAGSALTQRPPTAWPAQAWRAFSAPPPVVTSLHERLLSLSGSGRVVQWRVAAEEAAAHPVLGGGAGSYERFWLAHRPLAGKVRDAHNLYLEVLAELGPGGLALLLVFLGAPLVALARARRARLVPAAGGAYVAFLAHAAIDWDWEIVVVTLVALACGGFLVAAAGREARRVPARGVVVVLASAAALVAFVATIGNLQLARAEAALRAGDWTGATAHARAARVWAPWSTEPAQLSGEAALGAGRDRAAGDAFRSVLLRDPRSWETWLDLARAATGPPQAAALARAAALNPRSPELAEFRAELSQGLILVR